MRRAAPTPPRRRKLSSHSEALLLSARQLADTTVAFLVELHEPDHIVDASSPRVKAAKEANGLGDGELLGKLGLLELDAQPLAQRTLVVCPAPPEDDNVALVRRR